MPISVDRRRFILVSALFGAASVTAGCGFAQRAPRPLAFKTLYLGIDAHSELGSSLRRRIMTSGTTVVVDTPDAADARLEVTENARGREILSLSTAGKVSEYQLTQTLSFRLVDRAGTELLAPVRLSVRRDYSYDSTDIIAKGREEEIIFRDMEKVLMQQVMDRLATVQP